MTAAGVKLALFVALASIGAWFFGRWLFDIKRRAAAGERVTPTAYEVLVGVVTDFFDTLGIGSFATTASLYRLRRAVPDRLIPGTLNVGHAVPTFVQAFIYIALVGVDVTTLVTMIAAAVLGAWLGSGAVARWSRRRVRGALGAGLLAAAVLMLAQQRALLPHGGASLGLTGARLGVAIAVNFALGALMTAGVGLYAPCMVLVGTLGMNVTAAFPIMMGSCAFLMPAAGARFISRRSYDPAASAGLTAGGIPAVLVAAGIVRSLPLEAVRWLVLAIVTATAVTMLRSALRDDEEPAAASRAEDAS